MVEVERENQIRRELGDYYPFKGHYFSVGEHWLHYLDEGEKGKPVLLMLHGNPSWSIYWRKLVMKLRADYRVIVLDHLGCGFSDKPQDYNYTLANHITNAVMLVEHLRLEKFSLFVHDWGGAIGMGLANVKRDHMDAFVVFNSAAFFSENIPKRIAMCRWPLVGKIAIQGFNAFAGAAVYMATEKGFPSKLKQAYVAPYNSFRNRIATYQFVQDIPMEENHPTRPVINQVERGLELFVDRPMLIIWGEKDWCFDSTYLQTWREKFPRAEVLSLKDSGHYVVEDGFDEYVGVLDGFLKKNLSGVCS